MIEIMESSDIHTWHSFILRQGQVELLTFDSRINCLVFGEI